MARRANEGPTDAELEILNILWQRERATVREVFDALNELRPTGYTTALKLLQIMFEKGLVGRDETSRTHVYLPSVSRADVQQSQISTIAERLFNGSCAQLVSCALEQGGISVKELEKIQRVLREHTRKNK